MAKMTDSELRALLAAQKADALASVTASKLTSERQDAMDYYMGDVSSDMPSIEGRSQVVSTDVADTIEGLMPSLMDIFTSGDEVVCFEPVGQEDIPAAEQETDYVNHVFMQQNPGFIVLYSMIKDALLSKVGVVKVWWEEKEREERETYLDQPEDAYALIMADPELEVVEHSEREDPTYGKIHDVTVVKAKTYACARAEAVPPEEFGIARNARSLRDCDYAFHKVMSTESKLIEQGFDGAQVKKLPSHPYTGEPEQASRDSVEERSFSDGMNTATRSIEVTEHYIRMDYDGSGAKLYRVTTAGTSDEIMRRDGKTDIELIDIMPFAAMTPVIITHRFFGRSIADLVMDIQRIKTALKRALLDNAYLANNPRVEVPESHAGVNTLDDLLVSRPGGIVRTKVAGGLQWQQVPSIGNHVFPLLEYTDAEREWRTGVTRQGQGIDANALQNQSATAVNQAFTAAQARMKLIARIFAETGIRDLFALLHATIRKHGKQAQTVRLRNQWVQVDPRNWKTRNDMTINVGLGDGGSQQQLAGMMALINLQAQAVAAGKTNLVTDANLYNAAKDVAKILKKKNPDLYFSDPSKGPPAQPPPDPKLIELQMKNEIEKTQAQADIATNDRKTQAELAMAERQFEFDARLKLLEHDLKVKEMDRKSEADERKEKRDLAKEGVKARKNDKGEEEYASSEDVRTEATTGAMSQMAQAIEKIAESQAGLSKALTAKRRVTGPSGKVYQSESVQ